MPFPRMVCEVYAAPARVARKAFLLAIAAAIVALGSLDAMANESPQAVDDKLRDRSVETIRQVVEKEPRWVKVHAAEYLLALGYPQGVREAFEDELKKHGDDPQYCIGIWRVLARAAQKDSEKDQWIEKLRGAAFDLDAPDRLHATETLAKLRYRLREDELAAIRKAAGPVGGRLAPYAAWILFNSEQPDGETRLAKMLDSDEANLRLGAAYALRHKATIAPATLEKLLAAAGREPKDTRARVFLVSAAFVHSPPDKREPWKAELILLAASGKPEERFQACQSLAQAGDHSDLPLLGGVLDDSDADLRATAAWAVLRTARRTPHRMVALDWIVIGIYALGMLSIGWYYSRRTKTREQYLLGDRQMKPMMVGLSLFAALISTISYLAMPGEVIKYGPVILAQILSYPLITWVVGWFMIPYFTHLKVTSAYEILDLRLGPSARTVGSSLFLLLRLFWMAVIIYATTAVVMIPLLGWEPWTAPIMGAGMALLAIAYTTMGGLRAAVLTDVIQTGILIGAAIATLVIITINLGGVGAWWPSQWPVYWPPVKQFDFSERLTVFGVILSTFIWYICTSASDQIAVQRYLSTRNAKAARSMFIISMWANTLVTLVLGAVGLGLLAYFMEFPHLLPDGQTVLGDSDTLFARYIVIGLPAGFSGLVVAGLLACAMSSLAAGVSSTCSVITVDFIDRFRHQDAKKEAGHVSQLRHISMLVGVSVILLSMLVYLVPGNLMEVCFKVVNLLTAPLGGLFFLALYVPWARGFGSLVGVACGVAAAVGVSYWPEQLGISWIWAMPASLAVEVGVGALVSLVPIGFKAPPLEMQP